MQIRAAVLVTSDRISKGVEQDRSGALAARLLAEAADVAEIRVVPDEVNRIAAALREWCAEGMDLILTVGGTGIGPRDVTPEATRSATDRELPGVPTALRVRGLPSTPKAMLSRAAAGVCGQTLIVNLPGSTSAVEESVPYLLEVVPHALEVLGGIPEDYSQ
ncbi:MAG: MogA/MoaB family molybdenum cofactor biosynthesis protein [Planctomycetota bacterium]|jgi:molybdenum cofactor synthesis domain-containing protein